MKMFHAISMKKACVRTPIILLSYLIVFIPSVFAQQLDETWTVTVNGQTVQVNPDGSFRIPNVSAPDQFGLGGPGTRPDFLSDDFIRAIGTSTVNGVTRYAFSEPFQFRNRQTFIIGEMTITDNPPPLPTKILLTADENLIPTGDTTQLTVTGILPDGSTADLTQRSFWTVYRTSNPAVATVGENGLVTSHAPGNVFITAVNEGATSVKRLTVTADIVNTTIEGFVQFEDGTPANDATVTTSFSDSVTTGSDGAFSIPAMLPAEVRLRVRATATVNGLRKVGISDVLSVVRDGITDAGIIVLGEGNNLAVAVRRGLGRISVVDASTNSEVSSLPIPQGAYDIAVSPDGNVAVVTGWPASSLTFVDLTSEPLQIIRTVPMPFISGTLEPSVACTATGLAVINGNNSNLVTVEITTGDVVDNLTLGGLPVLGTAVTPDGRLLLACQFSSRIVRVVSISDDGQLTDTGLSVQAGGTPQAAAVSPNGTVALVSNYNSGNVGVLRIDGQNVSFVKTIPIGGTVYSAAFTPAGDKAYVNSGGSVVSVLQIDDNDNVSDVVTTIQLAGGATGFCCGDDITVTTDGSAVLVSTAAGVDVIDALTDQFIGTIPTSVDTGGGGIDAIP